MTGFEPARPQDKVIILKRVPVFASCTDEQLHLIADRTRLVEYKKGECIYREGDAADAFYIVSSGRLRIFSQASGEEKTMAVLHNGDSFGEISLLTGETHSATVQALNDALVLQLQKKDFDEVINRIPSLVLYLSRVLSKRLRTREMGGEFSEATIAAVYSAAKGVGRTSFTIALAATLKRETGHEVIVVDFSAAGEGLERLYAFAQAPHLQRESLIGLSAEEAFRAAVCDHPLDFSVLFASELLAASGGEQAIAPLLSFLTNRFHYILIDLPVEVNPGVLKALTQADLMYLVTDAQEEHVIRTNALIHQLQSSINAIEQRMKVVLNMVGQEGKLLPLAEVKQQLRLSVHVTLPYVVSLSGQLTPEELARLLESRASPYTMTVRRIAREMGGLLVGLALGSGAALGLAHVGVLKVIERENIPIDIIAGSSIGAFIGGLWAAGYSAAQLEQMALRFKNPWDVRRLFIFDFSIPLFSILLGIAAGMLLGLAAGPWTGLLFGVIVCVSFGLVLGPLAGGPIKGSQLMVKLREDFAGKTFEDTWLPLKVVASNPVAREEIVFESGSIAEAVRASVSIPGIFKPVMYQGKMCLDGGVANPIPVSVLKRAGAHHVIAVNVFPSSSELAKHRQELQRRRAERDAQLATRSLPFRLFFRIRQELLRTISPMVFDVIMRSMQAMEYQIAEVSCREADITLRPTVPGSHWLEFFNPEPFIRRGEEVALQHLPELKRIARMRSVDNAQHGQVG
ncbi:MAG: cyclic nucleotide-binding domain-containing protein [Candidatus Omnitrophica bacterium]|nr:cyclic nucleotide-binding domain-containing protein [Candidatus Omnitrophota bacterium]